MHKLCVSVHFIPWKERLRTTTLSRRGKIFPRSLLRPSIQEFPVMQGTVCMCTVYVVVGRQASEGLQGNPW